MRTALVLLFLLALASVPGSALPQRSVSVESVARFYERYPDLAPTLDRLGAFNVFNQAYPVYRVNSLNDFDLTLEANCNRRLTGVPNGAGGTSDVCDPTGGFTFTQNTINNFGKIITKRGHRVIELALRLFF